MKFSYVEKRKVKYFYALEKEIPQFLLISLYTKQIVRLNALFPALFILIKDW